MRLPILDAESRTSLPALLLECAPILFVFTVYTQMVRRGLYLPAETYEGASIVAGGLAQPRFLVFVLLPVLLLLPFWKRLRWSEIRGADQGMRIFVGAVCLASAFTFTTYDYNLYLDRAHLFDRLLLLAVAAASFRHPWFASLYGALGMLVVSQFSVPIGLFTWLDKRILFVVLQLLTALLALAVVRRQRAVIFAGLATSLLAANYVFPAIAKLRTDWLWQDDLANLAVMTHLNGWFGRIDTDRYMEIVNSLKWLNPVLIWGTIVTEVAALFMFVHRRYLTAVILATVALHAGIFLSSGICFWKWVLFNLGALWMVRRNDEQSVLFSRAFLLISMATILTAPWHARPSWLVWYDTPADEFVEVEAVGISGTEYHVERGFFEPHDIVFAQNRFYFLNPEPTLLGTFGATADGQLDLDLQAARSPAEADSIIEARATSRYDEEARQELSRYLRLFFATLNERGSKELWISHLRAPHHIWNQRPDPVYALQEPVREVKLVFHRVYYDGERVHELQRRVLEQLEIPMTRDEVLAGDDPAPAPASR